MPAGPASGERLRVRMTLAYHGAGFHGFAAQPGLRTVAGVLGEALAAVLHHEVELTCAGRTDKGVHAWGQVVSFDAAADRLRPEALVRSLNTMCGPAIVVRAVELVPGFDARRDAFGRVYRYRILNAPLPDPFGADTAWHVAAPLDLAALRLAADPLIGEHDFSSFCRRPGAGVGDPLVREVRRALWSDRGDGRIELEIEASAFCHQMVRSIVGTMVDMGRGHLRAGQMRAILAARDRRAAGQVAPPHGLVLWQVHYRDRSPPPEGA